MDLHNNSNNITFWFVCLCAQRRDGKAFHEIKYFKTRVYFEVPYSKLLLKPQVQFDILWVLRQVTFLSFLSPVPDHGTQKLIRGSIYYLQKDLLGTFRHCEYNWVFGAGCIITHFLVFFQAVG